MNGTIDGSQSVIMNPVIHAQAIYCSIERQNGDDLDLALV